MMRRRVFLTGALALPLAGCSDVLGPGAAPGIHVLHADFPSAPPGAKVPWSLAVLRPDTLDSLDTARIPVIKPDGTMDYYAGAQFPDRVPTLVQDALVAALDASGRIDEVSHAEDGLQADYNLLVAIRDFEARYGAEGAAPTAVVTLSAKLVAARGRRIMAGFATSQSAPASADSVAAAVAALEIALKAGVKAIVDWALAAPLPPVKP